MNTVNSFAGHVGRCWPLLGWRLVVRIGALDEHRREADRQ